MTPVEFREVRGRAGIAQIRSDWLRILDGFTRPVRFYHMPEWYESRLDALEPNDQRLALFVASRAGTPVAIFPLTPCVVKRKGLTFRGVETPQSETSTFTDAIFAQTSENTSLVRQFVRSLQRARRGQWDVLRLVPLLDDSNMMFALRSAPPSRLILDDYSVHDVLVADEWEAFAARLSKNFRGNLRKARNKLHAEPSRMILTTRDPAELLRYYPMFLEVEASGWKGKEGTGTAISTSPRQVRFFQSLIERFGPLGQCEINLLLVDERCVAAQFCLMTNHVAHVSKIGYDEAYSRFSPGQMLLEDLIRRLSVSGPREIDLASDAAWHRDWKPDVRPVHQAYVFNSTPLGLFGFAGFQALSAIRRARGATTADHSASLDSPPPAAS